MKKAFTLLELIFVIVLVGVISGIGFYLTRPNYPQKDAQYVLLKLKEARYQAIGYEAYTMNGCVTFSSNGLVNDTYSFKSFPPILSNRTLCFDGLGRPHDGNSTALSTFLPSDLNITFSKGTQTSTIRLFRQSGYAIIVPCNT